MTGRVIPVTGGNRFELRGTRVPFEPAVRFYAGLPCGDATQSALAWTSWTIPAAATVAVVTSNSSASVREPSALALCVPAPRWFTDPLKAVLCVAGSVLRAVPVAARVGGVAGEFVFEEIVP